jgi:hypothetical protein
MCERTARGSSLGVDRAKATGKNIAMKSAYELAMERLEKQSPSASLSEEQKREIADIESNYRARIAEKEVFLNQQIEKARAAGDAQAIADHEKQLAYEIKSLRESCEAQKEKIRQSN